MAESNQGTLLAPANPIKTKKKVPLGEGRSLIDWVRFSSSKDLSGNGGRPLQITEEQLKKHSAEGDAWILLNGKVFNITPYIPYHPGGIEEILRGAGKDATDLFNQNHRWVNYESMLKNCFVGWFVGKNGPNDSQHFLPKNEEKIFPASSNFDFDFKESQNSVELIFDFPFGSGTGSGNARGCFSLAILKRKNLDLIFRKGKKTFLASWEFENESIENSLKVSPTTSTSNRFVISFLKSENRRWNRAGELKIKTLEENFENSEKFDEFFWTKCRISGVEPISHDTKLFTLEFPEGHLVWIPPGFHIFLKRLDSPLVRPYTPVVENLSKRKIEFSNKILLMIKIYSDGEFSRHLQNFCIDESLMVSHAVGRLDLSEEKFSMPKSANLLLIAAGTGLTPMAKLIPHFLSDGKRTVHLLFFNKTEEDILWRQELENLQATNKNFRVLNILSDRNEKSKNDPNEIQSLKIPDDPNEKSKNEPNEIQSLKIPDDLNEKSKNEPNEIQSLNIPHHPNEKSKNFLFGRINSKLLQENFFHSFHFNSIFVFICGSIPFNSSALEALEKLGFSDFAKIHVFSQEG